MFFFFNDTATTEIYTLSLHDALPISRIHGGRRRKKRRVDDEQIAHLMAAAECVEHRGRGIVAEDHRRSEEHTSELQSLAYLVCRLLLEKKKKNRLACVETFVSS